MVALVLALVVNFAFCYLSLGLSVLAFAAIARAHMRLRGEGPPASEPSTSDDALDVLDVPEPAPVSEREARPRRRPFFPIADYDELTAAEVVSVLGVLDVDELELVRAREEDGPARTTVLKRIDQRVAAIERQSRRPS